MPVPDKKAGSMATTFSPGQIPDLPNVVPSLLELEGMQDQNNRWQDWWDSVKQALFKTEQNSDILLRRGAILIKEETTARETADGFLEGKYTLTVQAGDIVTGMEITSSTGPNAGTVSQVSFRADKFMIYSGTTSKIMFVADAIQNKVRLGDVFTVDSASQSIYIKTTAGAGAYANSSTPFYADATGQFSMGSRLTWNGTTLTIGLAVVDSGGSIVLGSSNDVLILSTATDPYRIWAGNATAGSAAFSVTKTGQLFSTSGTIGGFTISSNTLTAGSGLSYIQLSSTGSILVGDPTGLTSAVDPAQISIGNTNGFLTWRVLDLGTSTVMQMWNSTGTSKIVLTANSGDVNAVTFTGSGANLTSIPAGQLTGSLPAIDGSALTGLTKGQVGLGNVQNVDQTNASNLTGGTLPNARLTFTKVPTGDVLIDGHVVVGGVKLATVA